MRFPEDAQHLNFYWGAASSQAALNAALAPIAGTHGFRVTWFEEDGLVRFTREGRAESSPTRRPSCLRLKPA